MEEKLSKAFYSPAGVRLGARSLAKAAGVSESTAKKWLAKQELSQIYKKPVKQKAQPHFDVEKDNQLHQADLLMLPNDKGYKYALVVVDGHSRKVDAVPLKDKTAKHTKEALEKVYERHKNTEPLGKPPLKMMTDSGSEFKGAFAKYMNDKGTWLVHGEPGRHRSQALAEAANKEIGTSLLKRMQAEELLTGQQSREWKMELPEVVAAINRGRKPVKPAGPGVVDDGQKIIPEGTVVRTALENPVNPIDNKTLHGKFRASDPRWSTYTSKVEGVQFIPGRPPMYRVSGHQHLFTHNRLQPVGKNEAPKPTVISGKPDTYIVEELLEKRKTNGKVEIKVKWRGYPMEEATWEPRANLAKDVPAMLKKFEKQQGAGAISRSQIAAMLNRTRAQ